MATVYSEVSEYFSKVKVARVLTAFFIMLFFFPYEILGVTEEFLYLISFVVFVYNLIKTIKGYIFNELELRRLQVKNLYFNLIEIHRVQVKRLYNFFDYVQIQDLELNLYFALNVFNTQLFYNFYLNLELVAFNSKAYSITNFNYILLKNNMFSELEETAVDYFNQYSNINSD